MFPNWRDPLEQFVRDYSSNPDALLSAMLRPGLQTIAPFGNGEVVCRHGDVANCFWFIVDGSVDIHIAEKDLIVVRQPGDLIGEQAYLTSQTPKSGVNLRTATMTSHGASTLLRFESSIVNTFTVEERALWYELLAHVVNLKLVNATEQRAKQQEQIEDARTLLQRFNDPAALGIIMVALGGATSPTPVRQVVVWFSDIAGFSSWSRGRDPRDVASTLKRLLGLQMQLVRKHGGVTDKFMGDGLMAYWFFDNPSDMGTAPLEAIKCAKLVIEEFDAAVRDTEMASLSLRIGMHSGSAAFGDFGTEDRVAVTILGETVNLSSRFEQLRAKDHPGLGAIRISSEFYSLIKGLDVGAVDGFKGPLEARQKEDDLIVYWL